jgi:hypothetical protein
MDSNIKAYTFDNRDSKGLPPTSCLVETVGAAVFYSTMAL